MFSLFLPVGHIATARDFGNTSKIKQWNYINIRYTRLCYWLRSCVGVRVRYTKVNVQYRYLLHDHSNGKV